ncbi:MAG: PD40 domain-containing protein [Gemmatimonadaceae bacterium]|nr:PD40 domain-containing protein [Gemmatimonadaceae bacterium]
MTIESPPRHPRVATARGAARTNSCLSARVALPAAALSAVLSAVLICPSSLASQATVQATVQGPARWNVETPTGPSRTVVFEAHEGTLMSLAISPDGQSIAFDLLGAIYELPIAGGSARRLTSGRSWNLFPRYSPDGRSIAFSSDRNGSYDVWVMNREGGALERVSTARLDLSESFVRPAWSTDGRRLYAVRSGDGIATQLVALDRIGGRQVLLEGSDLLGGAIAEPRGAGVLFERNGGSLYAFAFNPYVTPPSGARIDRYDEATGEVTTSVARPGGAFAPALSPNGQQLAYVHRAIDETVLMVRDLVTGRERVALRGLDRDRQQSASTLGPFPAIAWHPDGKRIFLAVGGAITAVDVTTGSATPLPFRAPVERLLSETIRFKTVEPSERASTLGHRWGSRVPQGVLYEALGDLWLAGATGAPRNLTNSDVLETSPVYDAGRGALYYAAWTDDSLGAVYRRAALDAAPVRLTSVPAQYGSIAVSPDGARIAYVRGAPGLAGGLWLSNETQFDLVLRDADGTEHRVTGISGHALEYANIAGKIPPSVNFAPDGQTLLFTEFEGEDLVLKRIALDGRGELLLYRFPNAVAAVPSPDLAWIALREYQRSFIVPWSYAGHPVTRSPADGIGSAVRVDAEDGGYLTWSADGATLGWTRARGFYEKPLSQMLAESRTPPARPAGASWTAPRVPGSTARRTELSIAFDIERATGAVALTGVRVITMNPQREVLENATIVLQGGRITALGRGVAVPSGAKTFDLAGQTVIPGLIDAHAHPHIEHSTLHVIEQQPTYLSAPLAYGVTTIVEVYGNEYRDGWFTDMLRAGKMAGPRFFTTGSPIFGTRRGFRRLMYRPFETLDEAREQLRWNKDHGAIAVKDYAQRIRLRRSLTIAAARDLGLNVLSESSSDPQMNFTQVLDGVTGIEHSMGLAPFHDDVVRFWGGTTAGMTPTLLVAYNTAMGEGWYQQASKLWEDPKLTRFITPEQLMRVRSPVKLWPEDMTVLAMGAELRKLYHNGTSLQLGAHGQMFGLDAHWELDLLARSGFTPAEVLEIATIKGATQHGLDGELGSLEIGKLADLVVLEANPLDNIANAQRIRYVVKNGVFYAGADAARVWPAAQAAPRPYFEGRE